MFELVGKIVSVEFLLSSDFIVFFCFLWNVEKLNSCCKILGLEYINKFLSCDIKNGVRVY